MSTDLTHTTTPMTFPPPHYQPFGIVSIFCFVIGVPANILSLVYFISKNKHKSSYISLLYMFMNSVDVIICLLTLPLGISNLAGGSALFFQYDALCSTWGYISQIVSRLSVFCIGVLSILRTISLICPFMVLSAQHIIVPVLTYLVALLIQQSIPWWYNVKYHYSLGIGCGWSLDVIFKSHTVTFKALYCLMNVIEFIIPLFPILISCVISIVQLRTSPFSSCCKEEPDQPDGVRRKLIYESQRIRRSATITIVILTMLYIVFNVPYCFIFILHATGVFSDYRHNPLAEWLPPEHLMTIYIALVMYTIPINSMLNPIVYIIRIRKLRKYVLGLLFCRQDSSGPVYVNTGIDRDVNQTFKLTMSRPGAHKASKSNNSNHVSSINLGNHISKC